MPSASERAAGAKPVGLGRIAPENTKEELEARIRRSGIAIAEITLAQGVRVMLDFFRDVRAEGCEMDEDDDMLLSAGGSVQQALSNMLAHVG